jgi:DNA (cytosine-5)-methyltransferase 1
MGLENQHINEEGGGLFVPAGCHVTQCPQARLDAESGTLLPMTGGAFDVTHSLRGEGFDASEDGSGRGTPLVPVAFSAIDNGRDAQQGVSPTMRRGGDGSMGQGQAIALQERAVAENLDIGPQGKGYQEGVAYTLESRNTVQSVAFAKNSQGEIRLEGGDGQISGSLSTGGGKPGQGCPAIAYDLRGREGGAQLEGPHDTANLRASSGGSSRSYVATPYAVRRLTPTECERLMGFPDGYTQIPWRNKPADQCPDGPRYKALGNSWAVNCGEYVFDRLRTVEGMAEG